MKVPSPVAQPVNRRVTHFVCVDCNTSFSMTDDELTHESYVSNCVECKRPISIQANQDEANLQVLELFGCEYSFVGSSPTPSKMTARPESSDQILEWIGKAKDGAPSSKHKTEFEEASFVDELL